MTTCASCAVAFFAMCRLVFCCLHSLWRAGYALNRALIITLFIRTRDHRPILANALDQKFVPAVRTLLWNWLGRRSELALRITRASIKRVALSRPLLDQFAFSAERTLHADEVLLHILALGISAARGELAETAVTDDHVAATVRTLLIERNVGYALA